MRARSGASRKAGRKLGGKVGRGRSENPGVVLSDPRWVPCRLLSTSGHAGLPSAAGLRDPAVTLLGNARMGPRSGRGPLMVPVVGGAYAPGPARPAGRGRRGLARPASGPAWTGSWG